MSKKTLIHADTNMRFINSNSIKYPSFIQAKNKLIASAKKHVNKNVIKNNILAVLSKDEFVQYTNPRAGNRLNKGRRGIQHNNLLSNSINGSNSINVDINKRIIFSSTTNSVNTLKTVTTSQNINKIDIFTSLPTASFAKSLAGILNNCGIHVNVFFRHINNADIAVCARDKGRYMFIFTPQVFLQAKNETSYPEKLIPLPEKKYFLYQFENLKNKNHRNLNPHIIELIKKAKHTFDCSPTNMSYYPKECIGQVSVLYPNNSIVFIKKTLTIRMLYPALFHKYILGMRNPDDNLIIKNYSVTKEVSINRKNICHIHCFYLKTLESMFSSYISLINNTFDIIVTYTHTEDALINKYTNITFVKVNNYGMDIGPKFIIYEYLLNKKIDYNYIFYIHSKSDNVSRNKYLTPFINNLVNIGSKLNENNATIACYFHNILWFGDSVHSNTYKWMYNKLYMNDILHYLNIKQFINNTLFEEGNFYILHKQIINKLFSDKFIYNILNYGNSFDYNWVKIYYNLNDETYDIHNIHEVYQSYKAKTLYGNNLCTNKGHSGLADAMIEHVFERLPLTLCKEYGISINILDNNSSKYIYIGHKKQIIQTETQPQPQPQLQPQAQQTLITPNNIIGTKLNTTTKTLCIVACHTSSDIKIKCVQKNRKYLEEISNDIVYINSTEFKDQNVMDNMVYIPNDNAVCYSKYLHVLQNMNISQYDNIILTNDSYLITKSLSGFKDLFNDSTEMTALCCSNEIIKHYPDFLRRYNKVAINKIILFYKLHLSNNNSFLSFIQNIEVKSHLIHNNSINVLYDAITGYAGNIHIDNAQLKDYLYNKNYPIIKIKKLQFTTYYSKQLPADFNPTEYRNLQPDLSEFSNSDVINHFINHGMNEGRTYKNNQKLIYPDFLMQYVNEIKFRV